MAITRNIEPTRIAAIRHGGHLEQVLTHASVLLLALAVVLVRLA
jgi:hypothetical protein